MAVFLCWAMLLLAVPAAAQMVPVPARPASPGQPVSPPERWAASRTACIDARSVRGAIVIDPRTLELVSSGGQRTRLLFAEDCAHLGYYGGFYYRPDAEGRVCAGRDVVLGREGSACRIREIATPRGERRRGKQAAAGPGRHG